MGSGDTIHIPSFMKMAAGVQAVLRPFFRYLRGCNVGITSERDSRSETLKCTQVIQYIIPSTMMTESGI